MPGSHRGAAARPTQRLIALAAQKLANEHHAARPSCPAHAAGAALKLLNGWTSLHQPSHRPQSSHLNISVMACRFIQVPVHVAQPNVWLQRPISTAESAEPSLGQVAADLGVHVLGYNQLQTGQLLQSQLLTTALDDVSQVADIPETATKLIQVTPMVIHHTLRFSGCCKHVKILLDDTIATIQCYEMNAYHS